MIYNLRLGNILDDVSTTRFFGGRSSRGGSERVPAFLMTFETDEHRVGS